MTSRHSRQYCLSMFISNSLFLLALLFYGASQIFYFYSYYRKLSPGTFLHTGQSLVITGLFLTMFLLTLVALLSQVRNMLLRLKFKRQSLWPGILLSTNWVIWFFLVVIYGKFLGLTISSIFMESLIVAITWSFILGQNQRLGVVSDES